MDSPEALSAADVAAQIDALHRRRDEAGVVDAMERRLREGLAASPGDYALLWRLARLRFWQADDAPADRKRVLAKEGWDVAERAVAAAPPAALEGRYYAAVCIGEYSQAVGILRALAEGLESRFNAHLDACLRDAPDLDFGGPFVAKGRYWYELPWPKRSLRRSREMLTRATERHPESLRAWLYLAETQLADGDSDGAASSLARVADGDVAYDPPEGRRTRAAGQALAARGGR